MNSRAVMLTGFSTDEKTEKGTCFTGNVADPRSRGGEEAMRPQLDDDPILRENRRAMLVRRLISHGLRTEMIGRLTGLTRNRLTRVRRRLMVGDEMRLRGPVRSALDVFRRSPLGRTEGAALISLGLAAGLFDTARAAEAFDPLEQVERLCDTYEAYREVIPETRAELEDFLLLYRAVVVGHSLLPEPCRNCRCLILVEPFQNRRECWHCNPDP